MANVKPQTYVVNGIVYQNNYIFSNQCLYFFHEKQEETFSRTFALLFFIEMEAYSALMLQKDQKKCCGMNRPRFKGNR